MHEPPRNIEAERSVLGSIMLDKDVIIEINEVITKEDFYSQLHAEIYEIMQSIYDEDKPIDTIMLSDELRDQGILKKHSEKVTYIAKLMDTVPSAVNARHYAQKVKDKAEKRRAIKIGQKIKDLGYSNKSSQDILDQIEKLITGMQNDRQSSKVFKFGETLSEYIDELEERFKSDNNLVGLPWPWKSMNELTGGLKEQNLIIVAARPSMGKTAVALSVAKNLVKQHIPVGIFSCEMSDFELKDRIFASETNLNGLDLMRGSFKDKDWVSITDKAGKLQDIPLYISKPSLNNLSEMKNEARKLKRKHNIQLLMVDYLQLIDGVDGDTRNLEVEEISRTFKQIGRELDIPVVVLAQLSRAVEQRSNKRPMLSDLRDSGSIEQDADLVVFLYRDEYYNKDTNKPGIIELIIGKQRNGPTDTVELVFLRECQRIEEISRR